MANRKITEMPAISGLTISGDDLLTMVKILEVDPTLRNKKLTFDEFRLYLAQFFLTNSGATFTGDITIDANATVSGNTLLNNLTVTGATLVSGLVVQNDLTTSGTISGLNYTGEAAFFTQLETSVGTIDTLSGDDASFDDLTVTGTITGNTITGTYIVADSGRFPYLSGGTITGDNISGTSGTFDQLTANTLDVSGIEVTGDLTLSGLLTASGIQGTGFVSGNVVTGEVLVSSLI